MQLETLRDLFIHELKDLYSAETQLIKALPKIAKAATNPDLKQGILTHLEETKGQAERLKEILSSLGTSTRGPKCKAMEGLIAESADFIEEEADPEVLDAGIIGGSQKIEHYEIAGYGTVRTFAELLGEQEAMTLLALTLEEEKATDSKLTGLALSTINVAAAGEENEDEEKGSSNSSTRATKGKSAPASKKAK